MLFGAHISVSGGYLKALDYAQSVGCECVQVFAKSPRQWRGAAIDREAAAAFVAAREERSFGPLFTHTAYLINLSTSNEELRDKSIAALADELTRGAVLGAAGVVTHVGNVPEGDRAAAASRVADSIARAFEMAGPDARGARLLLENTAGAGTTYGASFEELCDAISATGMPSEQLGICIDTCHGFANGYELHTAQGWADAIEGMKGTVGIERLGLIHANDCKFELGTKHDRHEWIGDGFIGLDGFRAMVCTPQLAQVPVVTEMPGEVPEKDAVNIGRLVALREECGASQ